MSDFAFLWTVVRRVFLGLLSIIGGILLLLTAPVWFPLYLLYDFGRDIEEGK